MAAQSTRKKKASKSRVKAKPKAILGRKKSSSAATGRKKVGKGRKKTTVTQAKSSSIVREAKSSHSLALPLSHHEKERRKAYYAMGLILLGISLSFLIYRGYQNAARFSRPRMPASMSAPHYEFAPQLEIEREDSVKEEDLEPLSIEAIPETFEQKPNEALLEDEFSIAKKMVAGERLEFWSGLLSHKDIVQAMKSLVNGVEVQDTEPLVPNRFDSSSFVETAMALAKSTKASQFYQNLVSIRYRGNSPYFEDRNYFKALDWIRNNTQNATITDATQAVANAAGARIEFAEKQIHRKPWIKTQSEALQLETRRSLASLETPEKVSIPYIALSEVPRVLSELKQGHVINIVHKDDGEHDRLITHQGLVIRKSGKVYLRYATRKGQVQTAELIPYLKLLVRLNRHHKTWPILGVNINQFND